MVNGNTYTTNPISIDNAGSNLSPVIRSRDFSANPSFNISKIVATFSTGNQVDVNYNAYLTTNIPPAIYTTVNSVPVSDSTTISTYPLVLTLLDLNPANSSLFYQLTKNESPYSSGTYSTPINITTPGTYKVTTYSINTIDSTKNSENVTKTIVVYKQAIAPTMAYDFLTLDGVTHDHTTINFNSPDDLPVYFTTNGEIPDPSSGNCYVVYDTSTFKIYDACTIKFFAFDGTYIKSNLVTQTLAIVKTTTLPAPTISSVNFTLNPDRIPLSLSTTFSSPLLLRANITGTGSVSAAYTVYQGSLINGVVVYDVSPLATINLSGTGSDSGSTLLAATPNKYFKVVLSSISGTSATTNFIIEYLDGTFNIFSSATSTGTVVWANPGEIYYTLDGTTPTKKSIKYVVGNDYIFPNRNSSSITVKAISHLNGYNDSVVTSETFNFSFQCSPWNIDGNATISNNSITLNDGAILTRNIIMNPNYSLNFDVLDSTGLGILEISFDSLIGDLNNYSGEYSNSPNPIISTTYSGANYSIYALGFRKNKYDTHNYKKYGELMVSAMDKLNVTYYLSHVPGFATDTIRSNTNNTVTIPGTFYCRIKLANSFNSIESPWMLISLNSIDYQRISSNPLIGGTISSFKLGNLTFSCV